MDTLSLINRAQAGDDAALEQLCARLRPRLFRWATGRLPLRARGCIDTGDLVQESMIRTVRRFGDLKDLDPGDFSAYLRTAVLNRIRDELRRVEVRPYSSALHESAADSSPSPLEQTIGLDQTEQFEWAMERLKPEDQAAIFLRIELDLSYGDLAELLGKPSPDAARMAARRALLRLAEKIRDEYGTE